MVIFGGNPSGFLPENHNTFKAVDNNHELLQARFDRKPDSMSAKPALISLMGST